MLVEQHAPAVYRLATAIVGDVDGRDAMQDAFTTAWAQLPSLRQPDSFLPWLRRICVNRCRNMIRATNRRGRPLSLDADHAMADTLPDGNRDFREPIHDRSVLEPAFERLSHDHREILALHYSVGLSLRESADALGIRVGTAKSRLNAGLGSMRATLGVERGDRQTDEAEAAPMSDDPIVDYLRTRGGSVMPPTVIGEIMNSVAITPQRRASWFAPLLPAVAAATAIALIVLLSNLVGAPQAVGPTPVPSVLSSPTPGATASSRPSASPAALVNSGAEVTIPALDRSGEWGTVRLTRGEDVGGYPDVATPDELFLIEVFVQYEADRLPNPEQFGRSDWALRPTDPDAEHFFFVEPYVLEPRLEGGPPPGPQPSLGQYPGAVDILTTPTEGWIVFAVPGREANLKLELVYQPSEGGGPASTVLIREPGPPPDPVARATTSPSPGYVSQPLLPITVIDSADADALFASPDTCTNPADGYTLTFPDDWYANTAIGDVPACSWFSPTFFEVDDPSQVPNEIAIVIDAFKSATGQVWASLYSEQVTIDGFDATRIEHGYTKEVDFPTNRYSYSYLARLDQDSDGRKIWVSTDTDYGGDYLLNKAVLDRIIASLRFTDGAP